jgi:hypothetical protein
MRIALPGERLRVRLHALEVGHPTSDTHTIFDREQYLLSMINGERLSAMTAWIASLRSQ